LCLAVGQAHAAHHGGLLGLVGPRADSHLVASLEAAARSVGAADQRRTALASAALDGVLAGDGRASAAAHFAAAPCCGLSASGLYGHSPGATLHRAVGRSDSCMNSR